MIEMFTDHDLMRADDFKLPADEISRDKQREEIIVHDDNTHH